MKDLGVVDQSNTLFIFTIELHYRTLSLTILILMLGCCRNFILSIRLETGAAVKDLGPADQLNTEFSFSCSALLVLRGKD